MAFLYELDNVTLKSPDGTSIVDSVSFGIQQGEFLALIGPSGAGKTSLFKLMNRLKQPTSGALYFEDRPLEAIAVRRLRQQVMLVGQSSRLLGMTARQALHYPLELQRCAAGEQEARVNEVVTRLQIPQDWLDKTELQLSGGQQQQVAIARALVARPSLLLLDEPTSALDLGAATRVLKVIEQAVREQNLSVVMSNHQLDLAQTYGDRILYLENGSLKQDQATNRIDWKVLKQTLIQAEAQTRQEWGNSDEIF